MYTQIACEQLGHSLDGVSVTEGHTGTLSQEVGAGCAVPAVMNAVADALSPLGIHHLDMPCTPERVWRAIQGASR